MLEEHFIGIFTGIRRLSLKGLTVLFLLVMFSLTTVFAESELIFDLRNSDLNKEAFSLNGIVEFYENQILDPGSLFEKSEATKQVIHFPLGLKKWSEGSAKESDLYGTLKMTVLTSPELAGTYLSLLVDLPSRDMKIWINGNRVYSETTNTNGSLVDRQVSGHQSVIFPAAETKQDILIQFTQLERKSPGNMAIVLGNPSAINNLVNSRFVMDMFFVMAVAILVIFVFAMVSLGRRRDSRRFRKLLHLVILACGFSVLRFTAIEGNGLLANTLSNYPDLYMRLKYAGLMLALPLMVLFMYRMPNVKVDQRLSKLAYPTFWFLIIVVVLGGELQFDAIVRYYFLLEMAACVYLLFKIKEIKFEEGKRLYSLTLVAMVLVYGVLTSCLFIGIMSGWSDGLTQYVLMVLLLGLSLGLAVRVTREKNIKSEDAEMTCSSEETLVEMHELNLEEKTVLTPDLEPDTEVFVGSNESSIKPPCDCLEQSGLLLWVLDTDGVVSRIYGSWPDGLGELSQICGSKAADVLFPDDATKGLVLERASRSAVEQHRNFKSLLNELPTWVEWRNNVFKLCFVPLEEDLYHHGLLVKFEDVTELAVLEKRQKEEQRQSDIRSRIVPEYQLINKMADDFKKYVRMDLVQMVETYETQDCLRRVLSDLERFRHIFAYYQLPKITAYLLELSQKLQDTRSIDGETLLKLIDDSAIVEDLAMVEQICSSCWGANLDVQAFDMQELDVVENALVYQSEDGCVDKVRQLRRRKLDVLRRSIENYVHHLAETFEYPLESIQVDISEVRVNDTLFWDLHKMIFHLINNAVEHGFESLAESSRKKKVGGNRLLVSLKKVSVESNACEEQLQLVVTDDGRGILLDDIRSRLFADRMMTFEEVGLLPDELVMRQVVTAGFSMPNQKKTIERGYGLHVVDELARQYGGAAEVLNNETFGTTVRVLLPYAGKHDYGIQRHETFIRALEESLVSVSESFGLRSEQAHTFSFNRIENRHVELEAYTMIHSLYWNREIQIVFTVNKPLLETVIHVYGVDFDAFRMSDENDILNEIVDVAIGGAVKLLPEMGQSVTLGKPLYFENVSQVQLKSNQVFAAHFSRANMVFTAYVSIG